ncbi:MAG: HlyD family efflux transporter periplasmic adaptor subunit, partial [Pirellulaceae bacterium]|nr:HlyD family efflux transporter periplasmic adaptor subunit [Pirellulaceae bacterium]
EKAENELAVALTRQTVLLEKTLAKQTIILNSNITSAEAKVRSEEKSYATELTKKNFLIEQIADCEIRAPKDGIATLATEEKEYKDEVFVVDVGAKVREGQVVVTIPDSDKMRVQVGVNEANINTIEVGQPVVITGTVLNGQSLQGIVVSKNTKPEPTNRWRENVKKYITYVDVIAPPEGLLAGLTVDVEIQVERAEEAIQIPVVAIQERNGKHYCLVVEGEEYKVVQIETPLNNSTNAWVVSGLAAGQMVVQNPKMLEGVVDFPKAMDASEVTMSTFGEELLTNEESQEEDGDDVEIVEETPLSPNEPECPSGC